ncbi:MBL fold metallo-hydrolase [Pseudaquabacterium rugosum]|uniref:MBL fold metallo-hydrolase n=1 Tax=Pseudaquabacterium rugosum TaxID=2984194 RepID=A0ABU9BD57_9BURK
MNLPDWLVPLSDGVFQIDTFFHGDHFDAAYLIVEQGRAAFVDTGTNHGVPRLLAALDALGLAAEAVDWVIPTHVHLDHAGGVGLLMRALPAATLVVHPRGARHLIDPTALFQGALAVYGATAMARDYGVLLPVAAHRVREAGADETLPLAGRPLRLLDTPGHARHHLCVWDAASGGWFTGDTFGLSYRCHDTAAGPWILPTSSPVQFEPDALHRSLDRLLETTPRWMYLTHFGRVGDVPRLAGLLHEQIDAMVALARPLAALPATERHAALKQALAELYRAQLQRHGLPDLDQGLRALKVDIELNAQGLAVWLDRERGAAR